jgi:hypothetical protein
LNLLNQEAGVFDIPEQQASQAIAEVTPHVAEIQHMEIRTILQKF